MAQQFRRTANRADIPQCSNAYSFYRPDCPCRPEFWRRSGPTAVSNARNLSGHHIADCAPALVIWSVRKQALVIVKRVRPSLVFESSRANRDQDAFISSVQTVNWRSSATPKAVVNATSVASRPQAMSTRPIRRALCRASRVHHLPPRYTSNQALKSPGGAGGTPISPMYPVAYRAGIFMQRQNVMARCVKSRQTPLRSR